MHFNQMWNATPDQEELAAHLCEIFPNPSQEPRLRSESMRTLIWRKPTATTA